ncbi:MAG: hypothetical protein GY749_20535 [Desulfobacteraceae bacterium]|nr:hypothetical protein [Desulfobacteraceae bacterium]
MQVIITPQEAISADAQWSVNGTWYSSGVEAELIPGSYTIEFKAVSGWTKPGNLTATVTANQTVTKTAAYTPISQKGYLQVTISPQEAISAGAQWSVNSIWYNSGTNAELSPGNYTVSFKTIAGFTQPADMSVIVTDTQTVTKNGIYTRVVQNGYLQVSITPPEAVSLGAQWSVNGIWYNSGEKAELSPGNYTVSFKSISEWKTPANQSQSVTEGLTSSASGNYEKYHPDINISGYVKDLNNNAVSDAILSFSNSGSVTTDSSGYYSVSVYTGWTGEATPFKNGYVFTPPNRSYTNLTSDRADENYVAKVEHYTVHTISLTKGWNIMSSYIIPENRDMLAVVQPLIDSDALEIVIDEKGNKVTWLFEGWVNNIGDFSNEEGYKIKVSKNAELPIQGEQLQLPIFIPYSKDWNITGYPCTSPQNAMTVVQKLIDNRTLVKVIDENGERIINIFGKWINNIGDFRPGEGYLIKVLTDTGLTVSNPVSGRRLSRFSKPRKSGGVHFTPVWTGIPYNSMSLWITGINGHEIESGDEIGIFDGDKCVGAGVVPDEISMQKPLSIILSQDDGNNKGFTQDHKILFRFWDSDTEREIYSVTSCFLDITTGNPVDSRFKENEDCAATLTLNTSNMAGDINHSGTIDLQDAILGLKILSGISEQDIYTDTEVNGDRKAGMEDIVYLLQFISGMRP